MISFWLFFGTHSHTLSSFFHSSLNYYGKCTEIPLNTIDTVDDSCCRRHMSTYLICVYEDSKLKMITKWTKPKFNLSLDRYCVILGHTLFALMKNVSVFFFSIFRRSSQLMTLYELSISLVFFCCGGAHYLCFVRRRTSIENQMGDQVIHVKLWQQHQTHFFRLSFMNMFTTTFIYVHMHIIRILMVHRNWQEQNKWKRPKTF